MFRDPDGTRSEAAILSASLPSAKAMEKEYWELLRLLCGPPGDSYSDDLSKISILIGHNYDTITGGAEIVEIGKLNSTQLRTKEESYGVLQIFHMIVARLEKKGFLPAGAFDKFLESVYHFDIISALYDSNWKANPVLCRYVEANEIARRHLSDFLQQLKDALIDEGASSSMVSPRYSVFNAVLDQSDPLIQSDSLY